MGASGVLLKTGLHRKAAMRVPARAGHPLLRPLPPLAAPGTADRIVLMAVEALDALVADMIRQNRGKIPRDFFDWIADDMTPRLEIMALAHFGEQGWPGMAAASATRDWVQAVCQRPLEQKLKGMGLCTVRQTPVGADPSRPSRAG